MPQRCTVCSHPDTKDIEQEIIQGRANTRIADRYGLDHQAVRYHRMNHLPKKLVRSVQKKEQRHAENMLDGIHDLLERTKTILDQAEGKGQKSLALKAIKEARSTYELLSKIAVKLEEYRRADEKKKDSAINSQISKGLQALSTFELKAFTQLLAKIKAADPDHELDPAARIFIDAITESGYASRGASSITPSDDSGKSRQPASSKPDSPRNRPRQDKNSQISRQTDELTLDDLSLDELELSRTIPSEETDPDWLKEDRASNPSRPMPR